MALKHKHLVSNLSFKIRCSKPTETNSDALYIDCPQIFSKTSKNTSAGQSSFSNVADLNIETCNKEIHERHSPENILKNFQNKLISGITKPITH